MSEAILDRFVIYFWSFWTTKNENISVSKDAKIGIDQKLGFEVALVGKVYRASGQEGGQGGDKSPPWGQEIWKKEEKQKGR